PVSAADLMRFLFRWQHVQPGTQLHGRDGLLEVIGQLQGLELPARAWETQVLPARIARYDPADLDGLCLSGAVAWGRLATDPPPGGARRAGATRVGGPLGALARRLRRGRRGRADALRRAASPPLGCGRARARGARVTHAAVARRPGRAPHARGARRDPRRALRR